MWLSGTNQGIIIPIVTNKTSVSAGPTEKGMVIFDDSDKKVYFYDGTAVERALALKPSVRGELEITDLNRSYMDDGCLSVQIMGRGFAWLDTGTHASLLDAGNYVRITEERQGLKICCPEEIAWRLRYIDDAKLKAVAEPLRKSGYGDYLLNLLENRSF